VISGTITVVYAGGNSDLKKDRYTVVPTSVDPDGTFTVSWNGANLKADSYIKVCNSANVCELNKIHTSCSQPLAAGDVFGSLTLRAFNGQTGGGEVIYGYKVTNNGDLLNDISLVDDQLGTISSQPFSLAKGASQTFSKVTSLTTTTTNVATASGTLVTGAACSASDSVTVTIEEPPLPVAACSDLKPIDGIKLKLDSSFTGGKTINSVQWYRTTVSNLNSPNPSDLVGSTGALGDGAVFTFDGFAARSATNDVDFVVTLSDNSKVRSRFHRSCSDSDMNDISDCGKLQGDGKDNTSGPNIWYLRDLVGNGKRLGCP
jgi:hypothetical protein